MGQIRLVDVIQLCRVQIHVVWVRQVIRVRQMIRQVIRQVVIDRIMNQVCICVGIRVQLQRLVPCEPLGDMVHDCGVMPDLRRTMEP